MAKSDLIKLYFLIYIFFNFLVSGFTVGADDYDIKKFFPINNLRADLEDSNSTLETVIYYVLIPFTILDILVFIISMLFVSWTVLPTTLVILMITPIAIFAVIDYILPMLRGN